MLPLTALLFALALPTQDPLPQDEAALFERAQHHFEEGHPQDAERAFKTFVERFPKSDRLEAAMETLAQLQEFHLNRPAAARAWLQALCERFPASEEYWPRRLNIADLFFKENRKNEALAEYLKIAHAPIDLGHKHQATHRIWEIQEKELFIPVKGTYTTGTTPLILVTHRGMKEVRYRLFRIDYAEILPSLARLENASFDAAVWSVDPAKRRPAGEWKETYDPAAVGEAPLKLPALDSGLYVLEAEHEGLSTATLLVFTRYGMITKSADGKLVVFVQDRATSKPAPGATIRIFSELRPFLGETDAQGLFVTSGFKGGTAIGVMDGEIFLASAGGEDDGAEEVRRLTHISTDRPIYRPGHTVHLRVVQREEVKRTLRVIPGQRLELVVMDSRQNKVHREIVTLNEFGSAETSFALGDAPVLGEYAISAEPESAEPGPRFFPWYGTNSLGHFRVDEYRKPEFKVQVSYTASYVIQGGKVEGTIHAEYYFGGPAVDAVVNYGAFAARTYWGWWTTPYYYDWYSSDPEAIEDNPIFFDRDHLGDPFLTETGVTDKNGNLAFSFPIAKSDSDVMVTVVAEVVDFSRRKVKGLASVKAPLAEVSLAVTTGKYVYGPGERVDVRVRATSPDEKPTAGLRITLKTQDRRWSDEKAWNDQLLSESTAVTDANGAATFSVSPEVANGYLSLTASATDAKGNAATAETWAWLTSGNWSMPINVEGIDLVPDKKIYEPGDVAHVLIQGSSKDLTVLVTLEGAEIYSRQVVAIKGRTRVIDIPLDRPDFAPVVVVSVCTIRGDEFLMRTKRLVVNPAQKHVQVEIKPDREEYRPREKARYEIRTTGADGRPVRAEVAFAIVDDSIFALQDEYEPDLRKHFFPTRASQVTTSISLSDWSQGPYRGGPLTGATFALDEPKEAQKESFAETEVRSKFADTMLWKIVRTDGLGLATVEVDVPDNLTTWRATARAVTADSRFGQERRSVVSRKPVIVRVETPRFMVKDDVAVLSAIVHNDLAADAELRIEFSAQGLETKGEAIQTVTIPSHGQKRFDWPAVASAAGEAKVLVKALGKAASDAMEVTLPVRPRGLPRTMTRAGVVDARTVEKLTVPADAIPGSAELEIALSPVHASMVLDALDSLAGYPYGCTEQTMSRFLPSVVAAGTLRRLGLPRPALEKELPKMIAAGLQRLYGYQHEDGGWGWWTNDQTNPWMTGYVLAGLAMAREAKVEIEEEVWTRAVGATRALLSNHRDEPNLQAYLLYALSLADSFEEAELLERDLLDDHLADLKPCSLALLAMVLHRTDKDPRPVLRALERHLRDAGAGIIIEQRPDYGWVDDPVEAAAAALRAYLEIDPKNAAVPKLVHGLGLQRRGSWWTSTRQTAMAVYALSEYLERTGELNPDMTLSLSVNGRPIAADRITKENWPSYPGLRRIPAASLIAGENEIVMERAGAGTPTYAVTLRYMKKTDGLAASPGALRIERTYHQIEKRDGDRALRPLPEGFTATSGQEIEVTLTFHADREYEWLMVEDPIPAGFEPIREYWGWWGWEWNYWYSSKEFHDERVTITMNRLEPGVHTASYTMRAETPGDFRALPARAFNMYFPDLGAHTAEGRLKIRD